LAVASVILAGGLWIWTGGPSFLNEPTPPIIYITLPPGQTVTPEATPTASPESSPIGSVGATPTLPPTATPRAAATPHPVVPTPRLANLTFLGSSLSGGGYCGEAAHLTVRVINNGPVATTASAILSLSDTYDTHEAYWTAATIPVLAPAATHELSFTVTVNSGCGAVHVITFRIDPGNSLPESSELDNVSTMSRHVEVAGPNLRVASIDLDPATPACAHGFDVVARVVNSGSLPALDTLLRVVDRVGTTELIPARIVSVPALAAHSSADVTAHLTVMSHCGERHQLVLTADNSNGVVEVDEGDNRYYYLYQMNP
jgi:subtilase family serine protease